MASGSNPIKYRFKDWALTSAVTPELIFSNNQVGICLLSMIWGGDSELEGVLTECEPSKFTC